MEHFFMPVMKMQERHLQAIGQPVPDDVMKAAKRDPENWYVEWYKGREPPISSTSTRSTTSTPS